MKASVAAFAVTLILPGATRPIPNAGPEVLFQALAESALGP
jgi:hypothetical protein